MSIKTTLKLTALSALTALAYTSHAQAEGKLTVYCSVQNVVCEKVTQAFSKKYNVDAQFVRNSTGVVLGKIKAEKENPQADFWFGGTIEPHLQAAELGLLESYRSPLQKDIMPQFKSLMEQRGNFTSVIYLMELGIGVNTKKLKELNVLNAIMLVAILIGIVIGIIIQELIGGVAIGMLGGFITRLIYLRKKYKDINPK